MNKIFTILVAGLFVFNTSAQTTDAGTIYFSIGNGAETGITSESEYVGSTFQNPGGMSFGSEWITGIEIDGDDDDDNGIDYWDDDNSYKSSNFSIEPKIGTFIIDGLLIGVSANISSKKVMAEQDGGVGMSDLEMEEKFTSISVAPFVRYYASITDASSIFFGLSYSMGKITGEIDDDLGGDYNYNDLKINRFELGAGISASISETISLEPSINYSMNRYIVELEDYYMGQNSFGMSMYDDVDQVTFTNSVYFKIAASFYF